MKRLVTPGIDPIHSIINVKGSPIGALSITVVDVRPEFELVSDSDEIEQLLDAIYANKTTAELVPRSKL